MNAAANGAPSLFPFFCLAAGCLLTLFLDALVARSRKGLTGSEASASGGSQGTGIALGLLVSGILLLALYASVDLFVGGRIEALGGENPLLRIDPQASSALVLLGLAGLLSTWISIPYLPALRIPQGEYHSLVLLALLGAGIAVSAIDLIGLWVALELMNLPLYALAGSDRNHLRSSEAGLKAFLTGAFSSAILLYGMALLYGATGDLDYAGIRAGFDPENRLALTGVALFLAGVLFKLAVVPFHQWAPDVYEGAPTPVSGFMSVILAITGFFVLLRFFSMAVPGGVEVVQPLISIMAVASMIVGSLMALVQTHVKRMLACAGIAHAGFLLAGFATDSHEARAAMVFYLTSFTFMTLGVFGAMAALARGGREWEYLADYAGLAQRRPFLAAALSFFLFALAGAPATAGFMARFEILRVTLNAGGAVLAIAIIITSVILFASYVKLPTLMYMREGGHEPQAPTPATAGLALALCTLVVLYLGLFPSSGPIDLDILELARKATE